MGETLEQRLENKKRIVLEKQGQIHSLLNELSELVQDGDRLAIEGYFRIEGFLSWRQTMSGRSEGMEALTKKSISTGMAMGS